MKTKQQEADHDTIIWAWKILRDMGKPEDTEKYWEELYRRIHDYEGRSNLREAIGVAIQMEMERRVK